MNLIKHELQNIILSNEQTGGTSQLKKAQNFLSRNAQTGSSIEKQQYLKSEEETQLIQFLITENLFYTRPVLEESFIAEGAEQRVYQFDDHGVFPHAFFIQKDLRFVYRLLFCLPILLIGDAVS